MTDERRKPGRPPLCSNDETIAITLSLPEREYLRLDRESKASRLPSVQALIRLRILSQPCDEE